MRYVALIVLFSTPAVLPAQQGGEFKFPAHDLQSTANRVPHQASIDPQHANVSYTQNGPTGSPRTTSSPIRQANYEPLPSTVDTVIDRGSSFPALTPSSETVDEAGSGNSLGPLMTTVFSLAVVLGLFAGLVWVSRRFGNPSMTQGTLSSEVLRSLGSTAIDAKTRVTMLRCGNRIIVMAQTATGIHPLSEITDPAEVQRLTAACLGRVDPQPTFAETLRQVDSQPKRRSLLAT